jgi:hypothetical protein
MVSLVSLMTVLSLMTVSPQGGGTDLGSRDDWRPGSLEEDELFARGGTDLGSGDAGGLEVLRRTNFSLEVGWI